MTTFIPRRGVLRNCPECGGQWPHDVSHELRGCGWLQGLARNISPSNKDVLIHDGSHGNDRFLNMELKRSGEPEPQSGQFWTLGALSRQPNWTVLVLRGTTRLLRVSQVIMRDRTPTITEPIHTHAEAMRRAVNAWITGERWADAQRLLADPSEASHVCGWARVAGVWTCIGDHYAKGRDEQLATACGATLPEIA